MNRTFNVYLLIIGILSISVVNSLYACGWMSFPEPDPNRKTWVPSQMEIDSTEQWALPTSVWSACDYNSECTPSLSADNKILLYCVGRVNGPTPDGIFYGPAEGNWNIYEARWNNQTSQWDSIHNVGPVVNPGRDPSLSPDGDTMWFSKGEDIFVAYRNPGNGQWDSICQIDYPVSVSGCQNIRPYVTRDCQRMFFSSNRDTLSPPWGGDYDIYCAYRNPVTGEWDSITPIGPGVNTPDGEGSPSLSADETKLYFTDFPSRKYGARYGEFDLYVSEWDTSVGDWGLAKLVPAPVNSDRSLCCAFETLDGKLYLGSEIWDGLMGEEDLMVTTRVGSACAPNLFPTEKALTRSEWIEVGDIPEAMFIYDLVEGPDSAIYAAALAAPIDQPRGVVYRSTNAGQTWVVTDTLTNAMAAHKLLFVGDTLYVGTYPEGTVFRSTDFGLHWSQTADLPGVTAVRALVHTSDGFIIAGTSPDTSTYYRIFRTTNAGTSWIRIGDAQNANGSINDLCEAQDGTLYAGGRHSLHINDAFLWQSTNSGVSWDFKHLPSNHATLTNMAQIMFITNTSNNVMWTGGWGHGPQGILYKSTDNGYSWDSIPTIYRIGDDSIHVARIFDLVEAPDNSFIIATQPGPDSICWRSTDGGVTWVLMDPLVNAWEAMCLLKTSDGVIFCGTTPNGNVYKWNPTGIEEEKNTEALVLQLSIPSIITSGSSIIKYTLPRAGHCKLTVHDVIGRKVVIMFNENKKSGMYKLQWKREDTHGNKLADGVYILRLELDGDIVNAKTICVR